MVQRQWCNEGFVTFLQQVIQAVFQLMHVGNQVGVGKHRTLGNTCRPPGILQHC